MYIIYKDYRICNYAAGCVSMIYFNCFRLLPVLTKVCRLSTGAFSHLKAYTIIKYYIELAMFHYFVYVSRATSF